MNEPIEQEDLTECPHCGALFEWSKDYPVCEECYVGK